MGSFHRSAKLRAENDLLRQRNLELERMLEDAKASARQLEKERDATERYNKNLRKRYQKLCSKKESLAPEHAPVVRERVVYHEDRTTIDALRAKCDELKANLWEYQKREGDTKAKLDRLMELEARDKDWKQTYHGIILRAKNRGIIPDLDVTIIDSKAYFESRSNRDAFEERHHLHGPYLVRELPYGR
jgi:chromosome segregation ATPase